MVALKGQAIGRYLDQPDPSKRLTLVYGPDIGLVSERAKAVAKRIAAERDSTIEPLDGEALEPGTLREHATALPLFGNQPVFLIHATPARLAQEVGEIITHGDAAPLIAEAADLKPSSPLRKLAEAAENAVAIPCYADTQEDLTRLIDAIVQDFGLRIDRDAKTALLPNLGANRMSSRGEIEKLCLYCADAGVITAADIDAISGDAGAMALDMIVDAACLGQTTELDRALRRAHRESLAVQAILAGLTRHFMQLRQARIHVEAGSTADAAMRQLKPPVFFRRQTAFRTQLSRWPLPAIDKALGQIQEADYRARSHPDLGEALTSRLALGLAQRSRSR